MSIENLKRVYRNASSEDTRIALDSFFKYNRLVRGIAERHGFTVRHGAALFSALSPNNDYHGNLRDVDRMMGAAAAGQPFDSFKVSTYGANKRKAWAILHGQDPLNLIVALKTRSFFLNIADPLDPVPVTIDGHMINCWRGQRLRLVALRRNGRREYLEIAEAVRQLAAETNVIPNQMQGILWITWRRMHGIKTPPQGELWDVDYRAAGLGWTPAFNALRGQLALTESACRG